MFQLFNIQSKLSFREAAIHIRFRPVAYPFLFFFTYLLIVILSLYLIIFFFLRNLTILLFAIYIFTLHIFLSSLSLKVRLQIDIYLLCLGSLIAHFLLLHKVHGPDLILIMLIGLIEAEAWDDPVSFFLVQFSLQLQFGI